jgi:hypothetical protein
MATTIKGAKSGLKKFRPGKPKEFKKLKVLDDVAIRARPGNDSVTYSANVESEGTSDQSKDFYKTSIQFFGVEFGKRKSTKHSVPAKDPNGKLIFHSIPSTVTNRVALKCSCDDFRFAFEKQLFDDKSLIGSFRKYKRKTPPGTRPQNPKNPNPVGHDFVNPDNLLGFCKHVNSLMRALNKSKFIKDKR